MGGVKEVKQLRKTSGEKGVNQWERERTGPDGKLGEEEHETERRPCSH